ncbi:hypothetical protein B0H16DRAFT_1616448 [Mycena metata]|uniref:Uncharacterized protein n=1 Tax=Mycena metata TaxID=1033252 RepID=A0AAD7H9I1_9AGAR|nr:hypothetical protein B0H16DRAFT_1616448 [Mycena metata]
MAVVITGRSTIPVLRVAVAARVMVAHATQADRVEAEAELAFLRLLAPATHAVADRRTSLPCPSSSPPRPSISELPSAVGERENKRHRTATVVDLMCVGEEEGCWKTRRKRLLFYTKAVSLNAARICVFE